MGHRKRRVICASLLCFCCLQGPDPTCVCGVGLAWAEHCNPFIIVLLRGDTVNQRDNPPASKLQRGREREREREKHRGGASERDKRKGGKDIKLKKKSTHHGKKENKEEF